MANDSQANQKAVASFPGARLLAYQHLTFELTRRKYFWLRVSSMVKRALEAEGLGARLTGQMTQQIAL